MKQIDKLINKIGMDKVLHFLVGNLIASFITIIALGQEGCFNITSIGAVAISAIIVLFASAYKEFILDDESDYMDILASLCGVIPVLLATIIGIIFNIASH